MPDQSSAATEHAILAEITAPLETLPDDPLAVVNADFPVALRGYDRIAVDAYVQQTAQLVAELQATRSPEAAVRRALERVGEQISGILQRAHDTAEEITAQSRREAEDRLEKARIEAVEIAAAAQRRVSDLDADTDRIWSERHRIVDDARELAQQLIALAETAADRFPPAETAPYDDDAAATRAPIVNEDGPREDPGDIVDEPLGDEFEDEPLAEEFGDEPLGDVPAGGPAEKAQARERGGNEAVDDIEQTVAFTPLNRSGDEIHDESEEISDPPEPPTPPPADPPGSSSVIPPSSQAANRRSSR
jgi:DivIVA domain-containing protein